MRIKLGSLAVLLVLAAISLRGAAQETKPIDHVQQWIEQLNSNRFGIRHRAYAKLFKVGEPALSHLQRSVDGASAEQRYRIERLMREIRITALKKSFARVIGKRDADIDLDEGMILIAKILDPDVDREAIKQQLDDVAAAVRQRLGAGEVPKHVAPQKFVDALVGVLRDDFKLSGNVIDYDDPDNSSIQRVFATGQGLPILISHVAVSVAERLDTPIVGLSIPRRYMIKYDGSRAPKGHPREDIIIDPFGNWRILTPEQVKEVIASFDPEQHLRPSPRRDSLARMLRNLSSDLGRAGEDEKAAEVEQIVMLLENRDQR